jgi:hypothetical protein
MLIYVCDLSEGKAFTKNRRRLSSCLSRITNRSFLGSIPYWAIKELIRDLKKDATKSSKTLVFVEAKKGNGPGFMDWKCFPIGKITGDKYIHFIEAESFIDLSI